MRLALLCLVFVVGCKERNPHFCSGMPDNLCTDGGGIDAPEMCSATNECAVGVCKDPPGVCVQCLANADCPVAMPHCDQDMNRCEKCTEHTDCDSKVCKPDGTCEVETTVAYVHGTTGTDTGTCSLAMPCETITFAMTKGKPNVKIDGVVDDVVVFDATDAFTLYAEPMATVRRPDSGLIMEVKDSADIQVFGLTIAGNSGATNTTGVALTGGTPKLVLDGVKVHGNGTRAVQVTAGTITVVRSNIIDNPGGGLQLTDGVFQIVGNMFTNNGQDGGPVGGVSLSTTQSTMHRLEFNSFHRNKAVAPRGTGIDCAVSMLTARNNIVYLNGSLGGNTTQVVGCTHDHSLIEPAPPASVGANNIGGDPKFVNGLMGDLHLMAGSPALGAADPDTTLDALTVDLDNQARTQPADLGADEVP